MALGEEGSFSIVCRAYSAKPLAKWSPGRSSYKVEVLNRKGKDWMVRLSHWARYSFSQSIHRSPICQSWIALSLKKRNFGDKEFRGQVMECTPRMRQPISVTSQLLLGLKFF